MNINTFLNKDNIDTLWDVITDENIFTFLSKQLQTEVYKIFSSNIKTFFESEKVITPNLIDLNKKYILLLLNYITKQYPVPTKIKILDEPLILPSILPSIKESVSKFDKELEHRQQDFNHYMNIKLPELPIFTESNEDKPITDMDKILKEMTAIRNYDIPQSMNPSQDTYKDKDKDKDKKSVTWTHDLKSIEEDDHNIFSKLKKVVKLEIEKTPEEIIEERISNLEKHIKSLHDKLDKLLRP